MKAIQPYFKNIINKEKVLFPLKQLNKVPVLRFPEFSGEWELKKLSNVCNKIMDGTHFSPKSQGGTKKYLTSKNIRNNGLDFSICNYISDEEHQKIYKKCPVKLGDVLLTKDGANTGNCCINTLSEEFSLLSSVAVLSGKEKILNNVFLLQLLQSSRGIKEIKISMTGQAIARITLEKINQFKFTFPQFQEQTKIANFLTEIDTKIEKFTQKKQLLERYKKGVMQQLFSQSLRFKDDNSKAYPDWEVKPLGGFLKERVEYTKEELPLYSLTIENGVIPKPKRYERRFLVKSKKDIYKSIYKDDFVYNPMNLRLGALAVHKKNIKVEVSKYYNIFYCKKNANTKFMENYLTSYQLIQYYNKMATGSLEEKKRVHYTDFVKFKIP